MSLEWIEGVPADWHISKAQFVLDYQKRDVQEDDEIVTAFRDGQVTLRRNRRTDGFTMAEKEIGYQHICEGDLVVHSMDGGFGAIGVSDSCGKASPVVHAYTSSLCDLRFVAYQLRAAVKAGWIAALAKGIRVRSTQFDRPALASLNIAYPSFETQQRIADYLDRETAEIDAAVADLDRYVELLEKRRQVMIAQSVTRGIGLDRARVHPCSVQGGEGMTNVKNSDVYWLGKVASDWEVVPAWRVMTERREKSLPDDVHLTPSQTHGVLTQKEYMDRTGNKVVLNLAGADNMKRVRAGDFIIHLRSFEGGIEASTINGKVSNAYTVLTPAPDAHFGYYRWFMKSVPLIEGLASSTDQLRDGQSINFSRFSRLSLPFPPFETQQRIADYLDRETTEIDSLISESTRFRKLLLKRRSVLIAEVVTGRKQV